MKNRSFSYPPHMAKKPAHVSKCFTGMTEFQVVQNCSPKRKIDSFATVGNPIKHLRGVCFTCREIKSVLFSFIPFKQK